MAAAQSAYARLLGLSMRSIPDINSHLIKNFCTALGELRQLVACVVCCKLLVDPYHPKGHNCDHFVCRLCVRGKKRLNPKCPKCNDCSDYKIYVEDRAMTLQLLCYKTLCIQILQSGLYPQLENQNVEVTSNINKPRIKLPLKSVQEFIVEGSEYDDIRDTFFVEPDASSLRTFFSGLPDEPNISKANTPESPFAQALPEQLSISDMEIEVEAATAEHHRFGSPIPILPTGSRVGLQRQVLVANARPQSLITPNWSQLNFSPELSSVTNLQEGTYTYVLPDPSDASYVATDSSLLIGQLVQIDNPSDLVPDQVLVQEESVVVAIPEKSAIISADKEQPHPSSAAANEKPHPSAAAKEKQHPAAAKEKPVASAPKQKPVTAKPKESSDALVRVKPTNTAPTKEKTLSSPTPPLPAAAKEKTLPPPPPLPATPKEKTLPPASPAAAKEKTLPPPPPAAPKEKTLPPPPPAAAKEKTLPPPPPVAAKEKTLPPPPPAAAKEKTLPPPPPAAAKEKTLPPPPPAAAKEKTLPPPPPAAAKEKTLPPPPPAAAKEKTLPPPPPAAAKEKTLPPPPPAAAAAVKQVKKPLVDNKEKEKQSIVAMKKLDTTSKAKSAEKLLPMEKQQNKAEAFKDQLAAAVKERVNKEKPSMAVTTEKQEKLLPAAVVTPVKKAEEHVVTSKRKHAQLVEEEKIISSHMRLRKQTTTIASSVQVQPPAKAESSKRQPVPVATKSTASKANKPVAAVDPKQRKHCRCGISGPSTPKTCRNNRCWCYINGNSCTDCSCQGCNNPHKQDYIDTDDEMDDDGDDDDEDDDETLANLKTDIKALKEEKKSIAPPPPRPNPPTSTTTTSHSSNRSFEGLTLVALSNPEQSQHPLVLVQNENNEMQCFNIFQGDVPIDPANYGFQRVQLQNKDSGNNSIPQYAYMAMPPDLLDQPVSGDGQSREDSSSFSPEIKKFKNNNENEDACPGDSLTATETAHALFEDIMSGSDDL